MADELEVVRNAQELIIHSGHQINLFDRFYKSGWKPKPTIVKHLRKAFEEIPDSDKASIRTKLGIDQNVLVFCSFGMIAPTKLNLLTLQAFAESNVSSNRDSLLVFVGELEGGEYGKQILKTIDAFDLNNKIRVTGYVNSDTYEEYLKITDIAIQLRANSRGETSGALLDCMAHGIPVIINSHGTFNDYTTDVVMKLLDPITLTQLSEAMSWLCLDETYRKQLGQKARREIIEKHHPEKVAAAYAEVIYQASQTCERKLFAPLSMFLCRMICKMI